MSMNRGEKIPNGNPFIPQESTGLSPAEKPPYIANMHPILVLESNLNESVTAKAKRKLMLEELGPSSFIMEMQNKRCRPLSERRKAVIA